jgi:MATE family multidrug resistance protein
VTSAPLRTEVREQLSLAVPLMIGHMGHQLMGIVDAAVLGHYSNAALAGAGVANGLLFTITVFGIGVVMGLDTLIPQALGAGEHGEAKRLFRAGLRVAWLVGVPLTVIVALTPLLLPLAGVEPDVTSEANIYVLGRLPAVVPFLIFTAQRSYLQAREITKPLVIAMVVGNVVNALADLVLVFGDTGLAKVGLPTIGLPALGVIGASLATTVMSLVSLAICGYAIRRAPVKTKRPERSDIKHVFDLGLPVGMYLLAEVGIFATSAVLAGRLGEAPAAVHQVAITLASFSFSIALGIGAATSVRVGRAIGAEDHLAARQRGMLGMAMGAGLMSVSALVFLIVPEQLAGLFSDDPDVVAISIPLLRIAAVFQLSDAVQAVASGALRGAGDNRSIFIANIIGHYAIGLPLSIALAFGLGLGAPGLWWGLSAGLTIVALALSTRFYRLASHPISRS